MKKNPQPFIKMVLCLSLLVTQSTAFAAYKITTSPSDESTSSNESICSLREAITMVNEQSFASSINCTAELSEGDIDTVTLSAGAYKLTAPLNISQSIHILGDSADLTTIDGGSSLTIFNINDQNTSQKSITLESLSVINGGKNNMLSKTDAGAINSTEDLLLNNVKISESYGKSASAILIEGAALTILNSEIFSNTGAGSVIEVIDSSSVLISRTRINNNEFSNSALLLNNVADFEINQSEITSNTGQGEAVSGSLGVSNGSNGRLINSTVAANEAKQEGTSGLYVNASILEIRNSTISANTDDSASANTHISGLLAENSANVTLINSVLAGNSDNYGHPSDCSADSSSQISSNSYNILGNISLCENLAGSGDTTVNGSAELALLELSMQGGSSQTLVPLISSPLLNSANNADCPEEDQRGFPRPINEQCDIGAVEMQGAPFAPDIEPYLKKVRVVEEIDIVSYVSRRESDIDPETLSIEAKFNHNEDQPENLEGTYKITQDNKLKFFRGDAFSGEVTFNYSVSDIYGRESEQATLTLRNAAPTSPEAVDDYYKTEGKAYIRFDVLDNDVRGSSNYDRSTMVFENNVKFGRLTYLVLNGGGGVFVYTPDSDSTGVDSFTYSIATKEGLRSNVATVNIELPSFSNSGDDDELGSFNLFMIIGFFVLLLSRRLNKKST